MLYLYSPECTVSVQNSSSYVHQRSISLSQVDMGDVLAEVVRGQDHHGTLVLLQGVLKLLVVLTVLWPHHQESCLSESRDQWGLRCHLGEK